MNNQEITQQFIKALEEAIQQTISTDKGIDIELIRKALMPLGNMDFKKFRADSFRTVSSAVDKGYAVLQNGIKRYSKPKKVKCEEAYSKACAALVVNLINQKSVSADIKAEALEQAQQAMSHFQYQQTALQPLDSNYQQAFDRTRSYYDEQIKRLRKQASDEATKPNVQLYFWKYGSDNLIQLERKLKANGLVGSDSAFFPLFSASPVSNSQIVDWKKSMRTLIYLIYKIAGDSKNIRGLSIFKFTQDRFKVNGRSISNKQLGTELNSVLTNYILPSKKNSKPASLTIIDEILKDILSE